MKVGDIILCSCEQVDAIRDIATYTFNETFAPHNSVQNIQKYMYEAFNPEQIRKELENTSSRFYIYELEASVIGYLKVNFNDAQTEFKSQNGMEIERIYVKADFQGNHIGNELLKKGLSIARTENMDYAWLGVWEHNTQAIGFYEHKNFKKFGEHKFMFGDEEQRDVLMKKTMA